jgi:HSP20 family protein
MATLPVRKREREQGALARLHNEMDDLFRGFFHDWDLPALGRGRWPALDIAETENELVVKAEVPGCKAEDIDISIHGNMLTISGEKKEEKEEKKKDYYHVERSYGSFKRDLTLGSDVDPAKIEATCKDGVLTVTLPKSEKAKPTKIKIKAG